MLTHGTKISARLRVCAFRAFATASFAFLMTSLSLATIDVLDTNGFETGYSLGSLEGQQGWVTSGGGGGSATIQGSVVESGSGRAVQVNRGAGSDDRWAVQVGSMGLPTDRYIILIDWDMNVTSTGAAGVEGPFFGVETYDDSNTLKLLGSLGVDATTGDVLYQDENGNLTESGTMATPGQWFHFQIRLDFFLNQYQVFFDFDSTPLVTVDFVDGPADVFTDADIAAVAANVDAGSQSQTGTAYFDNFLVRNVAQADFNIDGDVDATDLSLWENAFGLPGGADADLDSDSDGADFLIWQRNFDAGVGSLSASSIAVPEPHSLALVAWLLLCTRSTRKQCTGSA